MENQSKDIIFLVKQLNKALTLDFNARLNDYGITFPQGIILFQVCRCYKDNIEVHQCDLEKHANLSKSSVSEIITRMEKIDLVKRVVNKGGTLIVPTEKGIDIVTNVRLSRESLMKTLTNGISEDTVKLLEINLQTMIDNISK